MTHWTLADGTHVEIINFLDDHSRLCVASVAVTVTHATDVADVFCAATDHYGVPASVLTDNGCIYTAKHRGGKVVMETLLETLGVTYKHSSPYHPQTCGKVERFHQTLKKFLAKQPAADRSPNSKRSSIASSPTTTPNGPTARSVDAHHTTSTHQSQSAPRHADPRRHALPGPPRQSRQARLDHPPLQQPLHHIGMGARLKDQPVVMLIADRDIRIISPDGELLRHLTLDPTRDYQPQTLGWISTMT